ncbi:MAG: type II toxin-antitoxin system VapC family toxin [Kiritimatiellales bacterium]|nr:type II toxin-antitoxin system VapC family toxin [Kiritimatiellales bacterium]
MVLVDTSIWIDHFQSGSKKLSEFLQGGEVFCHPFIIGELACGNLANRKEIIALLHALPQATKAQDDEVLFFLEKHKLSGTGIGLIDLHLLASAKLTNVKLWTKDKRLGAATEQLNLQMR